MRKKILNILAVAALAVLCLGVLSSCRANSANFFEYSEKDLGPIGQLVFLMDTKWIHNYGWTVVVFTVFLKIVMLPLDFWQRYSSRKSSLKMQRMQPLVEAIDKRFGENTQRANEEKQKLYKKQGYSMASMCLPMLITMAIFFVMFGGLRNYSTYISITSYRELSEVYHSTYIEEINKNEELSSKFAVKLTELENDNLTALERINLQTEIIAEANKTHSQACATYEQTALEAVKKKYQENRHSWLWIQNVSQPDTWATIMQPYEGNALAGGGFSSSIKMNEWPGKPADTYNKIRNAVLETGVYNEKGSWNGLMILPFMSIGLSFLSTFIAQRQEKKNRKGEVSQQNQQQAATNKTMMIIMPLMMAYFGFIYTGAFAIYMVVNYTISIISTLALRIPVEKAVLKKLDAEDKKNNSSKASYMR